MSEKIRPTVKQENETSLPKAGEVFTANRRGYVVVRNSEYVKAVASGDMAAMREHAPRFNAKYNPPSDESSEEKDK